jgi:voltage-gated potassium channel
VRRPDNLLLAGLRLPNCQGVLALTSDNEVNLKVALAAKLMHPSAKVVCRADSHEVEANMASFGTDHIYDPFDTFALYFATALQAPCLTLLRTGSASCAAARCGAHLSAGEGLWIICGYGRFGKALYAAPDDQDTWSWWWWRRARSAPASRTAPSCTARHRGGHPGAGRCPPAVGLIAGTDNDANNLSIVMTAKALNPSLFTVVRENHLMNRELFDAVGADVLMHPSLIVANRIRMLLGTPLLTEFVSTRASRTTPGPAS